MVTSPSKAPQAGTWAPWLGEPTNYLDAADTSRCEHASARATRDEQSPGGHSQVNMRCLELLQQSNDHEGGRTQGYMASGLSQTAAPSHPTIQPPRPTGDLLLLPCPHFSELGRRRALGSPSACGLYTQCP